MSDKQRNHSAHKVHKQRILNFVLLAFFAVRFVFDDFKLDVSHVIPLYSAIRLGRFSHHNVHPRPELLKTPFGVTGCTLFSAARHLRRRRIVSLDTSPVCRLLGFVLLIIFNPK
jgi:hypothetical protein